MSAQPQPQTKFAGKANVFTGEPLRKVSKPTEIRVEDLTVAEDPLPMRARSPVYKYDTLFAGMTPGQCLVCKPEQVGRLAHAMNTWIKRKGYEQQYHVRSIKRYNDTDSGRVWLLTKGRNLKVVK